MTTVNLKKIITNDMNETYVAKFGDSSKFHHFKIPISLIMSKGNDYALDLLKKAISQYVNNPVLNIEIARIVKPTENKLALSEAMMESFGLSQNAIKKLKSFTSKSMVVVHTQSKLIPLRFNTFLYKTLGKAISWISISLFDILYKWSFRACRFLGLKFIDSKIEKNLLKLVPSLQTNLVINLGLAVREEDLDLGIQSVLSDIQELYENKALCGNFIMPHVSELPNQSGGNDKVYAIYASVVLDSNWKLDGFKYIKNDKTKKSFNLLTLTREGSLKQDLYNNEDFPYQNNIIEVVNVFDSVKEFEDALNNNKLKTARNE